MKKITKKIIILSFMICILITGCNGKVKKNNVENVDKGENIEKVPSEYDDNGIFEEYYDEAYQTLESMTIEEKIGQMLFVRMPQSGVTEVIKNYHVGGFIMFKVDFQDKTKENIQNNIKKYQQTSKIPLLLGVDEEGGTVVRISSNKNLYKQAFASPQEIFNSLGMEGIIDDTKAKANLLKELGLNVNLAPVADVSTNENDYIYDRSFGKDANETKEYITNVVNTYNSLNMGCTLKHFPGYGNNVDTHTGIAIDNRSYETFLTSDFIPFEAGINAKAPSILVSHNIINSVDSKNPASLSLKIHDILRNDLNFTGVIMTDDLAMDAIKNYSKSPSVQAVEAGNNLIITTDYKTSYNDILNAYKNKEITQELIDKAVFKVLAWKYSLGLLK